MKAKARLGKSPVMFVSPVNQSRGSSAAMATFHWLLLNRHATARELKRLELQIAALQERLGR